MLGGGDKGGGPDAGEGALGDSAATSALLPSGHLALQCSFARQLPGWLAGPGTLPTSLSSQTAYAAKWEGACQQVPLSLSGGAAAALQGNLAGALPPRYDGAFGQLGRGDSRGPT